MRSSQAFAGPQPVYRRRTAVGVVRNTGSAARAASFILCWIRRTSPFGVPLEYHVSAPYSRVAKAAPWSACLKSKGLIPRVTLERLLMWLVTAKDLPQACLTCSLNQRLRSKMTPSQRVWVFGLISTPSEYTLGSSGGLCFQ